MTITATGGTGTPSDAGSPAAVAPASDHTPSIGNRDARSVHGWSGGSDALLCGGDSNVLREVLGELGIEDVQPVTASGADLLRLAATSAEAGSTPLVLLASDLRIALPALLDVLDSPVVATAAAVATTTGVAGLGDEPTAARVGPDGRLIEAVGTAGYAVAAPNGVLPGVLRVDAADRPAAAAAWRTAATELDDRSGVADGTETPAYDLLLVALVRHGVQVRAVPLGPFDWSRGQMAAHGAPGDAWRQRLRGASRAGDGFYSTFVVRRLSRRLTGIGLKRGWRPNAVSLASLALGVTAAALVASGSRLLWIAAAVLLQVALVVDCVDGELARYTRRFSPFGAWLDGIGDRVKEYAVVAAVGAVLVREGSAWGWLLSAGTMALITVRHLEDFAYVERLAPTRASRPVGLRMDEQEGGADPSTPPAWPRSPSAAGAVVFWVKKVVHMPIAERYLVLSALLVVGRPLLVLVAMLVLVGFALVWTVGGRTARALLRHDYRAPIEPAAGSGRFDRLDHQLDLGALARSAGRLGRLPRWAAAAAMVLLLLAALAPWPPPEGPLAWLRLAAAVTAAVLLGLSLRPPVQHAFGWQLPGWLWGTEVLVVLGLCLAAPATYGAAPYAYLAAVAYHRYDTIYRLRTIGQPPAPWLGLVCFGIDGRVVVLVAVAALAVAPSALAATLALGAAYLAAWYITESAVGWRRATSVSDEDM